MLGVKAATMANQRLLPTCHELSCARARALYHCQGARSLSTKVAVGHKAVGSEIRNPKETKAGSRAVVNSSGLNWEIQTLVKPKGTGLEIWLSTYFASF